MAVQADVDARTVAKVIDSFTDVVTAVVAKGEAVSITGFAKFARVERAARMGRNPATGEQIRIKASKKARITPAKAFKDAVLTRGGGPKLNRGVWPVNDEAVKAAGKSAAPVAKAPAAKAPAAKAPAKKAPAAKAPAKAPANKAPAAKAPAKKAPAKKAPAAKAPAKKAPAAKAPAKKAPAKRPAAR